MMHDREKSDLAIVAGKPTNKAGQPAAEPVEPRAEAKGNASQQSTRRTQSRVSVSHALERIRQTVKALPSHPRWGQRLALGRPKLDNVGAISLRAKDHDPVLAGSGHRLSLFSLSRSR